MTNKGSKLVNCEDCSKKISRRAKTCPNCGLKNRESSNLSNIVSTEKFIILSIFTFGFYELVWMYRNWKYFKEKEKTDISPFLRAWFGIFFIYPLLKKILKYAKKSKYKKDFSPGWRTTGWILLLFIASKDNIFGWTIGFLTFLVLLSPLNAMNFYYRKNESNSLPRKWMWWHTLLVILMIILWVLTLVGMTMPEV